MQIRNAIDAIAHSPAVVIATYDDYASALQAIERLSKAGIKRSSIRFAMAGHRPPHGIAEIDNRVARIVSTNIGSSVGMVVGVLIGAVSAFLLEFVEGWALPLGALAGLFGGGLTAEWLHSWDIRLSARDAQQVEEALQNGRAVLLVKARQRNTACAALGVE